MCRHRCLCGLVCAGLIWLILKRSDALWRNTATSFEKHLSSSELMSGSPMVRRGTLLTNKSDTWFYPGLPAAIHMPPLPS